MENIDDIIEISLKEKVKLSRNLDNKFKRFVQEIC